MGKTEMISARDSIRESVGLIFGMWDRFFVC